MTLVLIIEDDPALRRTLELNLRARDFEVEVTGNGEDGLMMAGRRPPDLVLLDLGLPGIDGVEVISGIRKWSELPIIVLSARGAESDKVDALDRGANDYLTKPFGAAELMARIRAAMRANRSDSPSTATLGDVVIDIDRLVASRDGQPIHLTPIEWGLVNHLVRASGQLVTQQRLLQAIWGPEYASETNYLRVHLTHLRQKLEPDPGRPRYFVTEPGLGYRFIADPA